MIDEERRKPPSTARSSPVRSGPPPEMAAALVRSRVPVSTDAAMSSTHERPESDTFPVRFSGFRAARSWQGDPPADPRICRGARGRDGRRITSRPPERPVRSGSPPGIPGVEVRFPSHRRPGRRSDRPHRARGRDAGRSSRPVVARTTGAMHSVQVVVRPGGEGPIGVRRRLSPKRGRFATDVRAARCRMW